MYSVWVTSTSSDLLSIAQWYGTSAYAIVFTDVHMHIVIFMINASSNEYNGISLALEMLYSNIELVPVVHMLTVPIRPGKLDLLFPISAHMPL